MKKWTTWVISLLALVGSTWGGFVIVDERYAKAGEVQQQIDGVKQLYLRSALRDVQREKFQIEVEQQRRALTLLEKQRLDQLRQEEKDLQGQVQRIEPRRTP